MFSLFNLWLCFSRTISIDIQSFSDADIELALSKLSEGELQVLEKVMENEVATPKVQKRGIAENDLGKICDGYGCKTKNTDEFVDGNYKQILTYEQLPGNNQITSLDYKCN